MNILVAVFRGILHSVIEKTKKKKKRTGPMCTPACLRICDIEYKENM